MNGYQPKVGDYLKCINISGAREALEIGAIYQVEVAHIDEKTKVVIGVKIVENPDDFWLLAHFEPAVDKYFCCTNGITAFVFKSPSLMIGIQNLWKRIPTNPIFGDTVMDRKITLPIPEQISKIVETDGFVQMPLSDFKRAVEQDTDNEKIPALSFRK